MDNLAPVLSGIKTYAVPLVQRARQSLEPAFNRIRIPNNPHLRNYLTAVVFIGTITGLGLVLARMYTQSRDKTGLSDYGVTAKIKDFASCTVLPGAGWVWRMMLGHPYKTAEDTTVVKAALKALSTSKADEKAYEEAWKEVAGLSADAPEEQLKAVKASLKPKDRVNYDHLPVQIIAQFFPEVLSKWTKNASDAREKWKWINLGEFDPDEHLDMIYEGFGNAAKTDANLYHTLKNNDPRKAAAEKRLDNLALQLEAVVPGSRLEDLKLQLDDDPNSNSRDPLSTAIAITLARRKKDMNDFDNNRTAQESVRIFKEWETIGDLNTLSANQLKAKNEQGETFLRLMAAKGHHSFQNVLNAVAGVTLADHEPKGQPKPTLLALAIMGLKDINEAPSVTGLILEKLMTGKAEQEVHAYINKSRADILANFEKRVVEVRKDKSAELTHEQIVLLINIRDFLKYLAISLAKVGEEPKAIKLEGQAIINLNAALKDYETVEVIKDANATQMLALRSSLNANTPTWVKRGVEDFFADRYQSENLAILDYEYLLTPKQSEPFLPPEDLPAAKQRELILQAETYINLNNLYKVSEPYLFTAAQALKTDREERDKNLTNYLNGVEGTVLAPITDLVGVSKDDLKRLLEKPEWAPNEDDKKAFVKAFAAAKTWKQAREELVVLAKAKCDVPEFDTLLNRNAARFKFRFDEAYKAATAYSLQPAEVLKAWKNVVDVITSSPSNLWEPVQKVFANEKFANMPVVELKTLLASPDAHVILANGNHVSIMEIASEQEQQLRAYDNIQEESKESSFDVLIPGVKLRVLPARHILNNVVEYTPLYSKKLVARVKGVLEAVGTKGSPEVRKLIWTQVDTLMKAFSDGFSNEPNPGNKIAIANTAASMLKLLREYFDLNLPYMGTDLAQHWIDCKRAPAKWSAEGNWDLAWASLLQVEKDFAAAVDAIDLPDDISQLNAVTVEGLLKKNVWVTKTTGDGKNIVRLIVEALVNNRINGNDEAWSNVLNLTMTSDRLKDQYFVEDTNGEKADRLTSVQILGANNNPLLAQLLIKLNESQLKKAFVMIESKVSVSDADLYAFKQTLINHYGPVLAKNADLGPRIKAILDKVGIKQENVNPDQSDPLFQLLAPAAEQGKK